ncbi:hypothetical protein CHI06_17385 [Bacillus sp. 7884-1]|nr:hypothetical protein CHI06_17385 [Bacillus sp. 7884-1]
MQEDEKILLTTPLPHAAGLYLYAGMVKGTQIYIKSKFDPENVLEHIEKNKVTFLSTVPTTLYLFDFMENKEFDVRSIRIIQYGTAPIAANRLRQGLEMFGQVFLRIYGLTETQSAATWLKKANHRADEEYQKILQCCGKSTIMSRIKIVDEYGVEVRRGIEGEIAMNKQMEGRFFVENRKTKIADMPSSIQQKEYTPEGFVDLDLEWISPDKVVVARAKENKVWDEGPVPTMFTALYEINIRSEEQQQISFPKKNELDEDPQVVGTHLRWVRRKDKEYKGDVWVKDGLNDQEYIWLKNVESAPVFFTQ